MILSSQYCAQSGGDDSTGWASALAAAAAAKTPLVIDGQIKHGPYVVPADLPQIRYRAGTKTTFVEPGSAYAAGTRLIDARNCPDFDLRAPNISCESDKFNDVTVLDLTGSDGAEVSNLKFRGACAFGILCQGGDDVSVTGKAKFHGTNGGVDVGIYFDAGVSALKGAHIEKPKFDGICGYGVVIAGGEGHTINEGRIEGNSGASFGFVLTNCTDSVINLPVCINTPYEGVNFTGALRCHMLTPRMRWDTGYGQDFGASMNAIDASHKTRLCSFRGGSICNSYKSAVGIANYSEYNDVEDMEFQNCGVRCTAANGSDIGGAVMLAYSDGAGSCYGNGFRRNRVLGESGNARAIGGESGNANANVFEDNDVSGTFTSRFVLVGAQSLVYEKEWLAWTPTVTPASGAITALGTMYCHYWRRGKLYHVNVYIPITTNGSAAGYLNVSWPFGTTNLGGLAGREAGLTGLGIHAVPAGSVLRFFNNSNGYPGGSGALLVAQGTVEIA